MSLGGGASRFLGEGVISLQDPHTHHRTQIVRTFLKIPSTGRGMGAFLLAFRERIRKKPFVFMGGDLQSRGQTFAPQRIAEYDFATRPTSVDSQLFWMQ